MSKKFTVEQDGLGHVTAIRRDGVRVLHVVPGTMLNEANVYDIIDLLNSIEDRKKKDTIILKNAKDVRHSANEASPFITLVTGEDGDSVTIKMKCRDYERAYNLFTALNILFSDIR